MTPEIFSKAADQMLEGLPTEAERLLRASASHAKDDIEHRVTQTGMNAKGQSFESIKDYDPAYKRKKAGLTVKKIKGATQRVEGALNAGRDISPTTLDKSVGISGRYRGIVDLTFTGRMWANIKPIETIHGNNSVTVSVGAEDEENKKKLEGNTTGNGKWAGRGEILAINKIEEENLVTDYEAGITAYVESYFEQ